MGSENMRFIVNVASSPPASSQGCNWHVICPYVPLIILAFSTALCVASTTVTFSLSLLVSCAVSGVANEQDLIFFQSTPVVPWLSDSPLEPRFAGSHPAGVDGFFENVNILIMNSFEREVKPLVPCRRLTARKRT